MNSLGHITESIELEEHLGNKQPKDPWQFATDIQYAQKLDANTRVNSNINILFNKGRYFESSIYDKSLLNEVSELTGLKVEYNNMICGSWKKLEDFVIAMNCFNIYVKITIDWI